MAARSALLALAASALLAAGCGGSDDPGAPVRCRSAPARRCSPLPGARAAEKTDGRLGGATTARPGAGIEELSRGGRPDVRRRADGERRDGVGAGASCPDHRWPRPPPTLPAMAAAQLCLLNGVRADAGLPPLTLNAKLAAAARPTRRPRRRPLLLPHGSRRLDDPHPPRRRRLPARRRRLGDRREPRLGHRPARHARLDRAGLDELRGSPANILNPEYREIGIGVVVGNPASSDGGGATYANAFGVVDEVESEPAAPVADHEPGTQPAKKKGRKGRKGNRRRGARGKGKRAGITARHAKKGKGKNTAAPRPASRSDDHRTGTSKAVRSSSNSDTRATSSSRHSPAGASGAPPAT